MSKNVVIFSDGTGQTGGINFDEDRSNVYKLFRATRCGPDSSINPSKQACFYDPGLGSQSDGGHLYFRILRSGYNLLSQATGLGITANIVDREYRGLEATPYSPSEDDGWTVMIFFGQCSS